MLCVSGTASVPEQISGNTKLSAAKKSGNDVGAEPVYRSLSHGRGPVGHPELAGPGTAAVERPDVAAVVARVDTEG